jgi:hypothetical protein
VYYSFGDEDRLSRTLLDQSRSRTEPHDGTIVGCTWSQGRWPGKQGLEFKQVCDRVRFDVPGEFHSLTLAAWVRLEGLPNLNNSLMMSDGWEPGELHWQIGGTGTVILGVQSQPKGQGAHYHATESFNADYLQRWVQIAVVYDHEGSLVTHYLDGHPVSQVPTLSDVPLRVGTAELGNWNMAAHRNTTPIRFLTGSMDEFLLFSRALSQQEIARLYEQGKPAD